MINGKKILAIITARGGSKGVPKKNILPLGDKPIIAWTIEAAKKSELIDRLILSSDCQDIINVAKKYGCDVPFIRPEYLATDTAGSVDVLLHAINSLNEEYDYLVLLQPTSIFRTTEDIDKTIIQCEGSSAPSCVSVVECDKPPYWMYHIQGERLEPVIKQEKSYSRRQDCPATYELNGAVYVVDIPTFIAQKKVISDDTVAYIMPKGRSLDIDTFDDLALARYKLSQEGAQ